MSLHPLRAVLVLQALRLVQDCLVPHGGQHRARQNAWAGMSRDAALGRDRREADRALLAAAHQASGSVRAAR